MPAREWRFWSKVFAAVALTVLLFIVGALLWMPAIEDKKSDRAKLEMMTIGGAFAIAAHRDAGAVGQLSLEGLVEAGILEHVPEDPWGNPYCLIQRAGARILCTLGSDGAPGGEGAASDLCVRSGRSIREVEVNAPEARACPRP